MLLPRGFTFVFPFYFGSTATTNSVPGCKYSLLFQLYVVLCYNFVIHWFYIGVCYVIIPILHVLHPKSHIPVKDQSMLGLSITDNVYKERNVVNGTGCCTVCK